MADVIKNGKVVDITKLKALSVGKSIQIEQKKREEKSIEEKIEQIEHDIKKEKAKCVRQTIKAWIAVLIWVAILVFSIVFFTNVEFSQAVLKNLTGVVKVLAVIGVIVAFLADIVAIFFLLVKNGEILDFSKLILLNLRKNSFIKGKEQEKASLQKKKETLFDITMETILKKTPDTQLINLVQENDPDVYVKIEEIYNKDRKEYLEKSKELSNEKQQEKEKAYNPVKIANETLNYFKTDMLKEIRNYLTVIPLDYFNEEAITGMLYYYTNKRGDTIKELINLYENEKFKEKTAGQHTAKHEDYAKHRQSGGNSTANHFQQNELFADGTESHAKFAGRSFPFQFGKCVLGAFGNAKAVGNAAGTVQAVRRNGKNKQSVGFRLQKSHRRNRRRACGRKNLRLKNITAQSKNACTICVLFLHETRRNV